MKTSLTVNVTANYYVCLFVVLIMATERRVSTLDGNATLGYRQPLPPAGRNVKLVVLYIMCKNRSTELSASSRQTG